MKNIYDKNNRTENYTTLSTYTPYLNTLVTSSVKVISCKSDTPSETPYNSLSMQNCPYMCPYASNKYINSINKECSQVPDIYEGLNIKLF